MEDNSMEISLLGLDPLEIFDSFGNFKPVPSYQQENRRLFEYGGGLQIPSETFGAILMFDYFLRALIQHMEGIKAELQALEKSTEDDANMRHEYECDLERLEGKIWEATECLRNAEIQLPQRPLKKIYDEIRQNPTWYLRKELVNDCAERGGCCTRSCGCCEKRCLSGKGKGIGHCTITCWCCEVNRGHERIDAEWDMVVGHLEDRFRSENPSYLLTLTEAYFSKPGIFGLGKMSMVRSLGRYCKKSWRWKRGSK
jgi:hypothetical protein